MPPMSGDGPLVDRLHGWKEIAAFFNRSPRAVQRWERELGLPVHRIRTAKGQTVYGLRAELEDWLRQQDAASLEHGDPPAAEPVPERVPEPEPVRADGPSAPRVTRRMAWVPWAVAAAAILVAVVVGASALKPPPPINTLAIVGSTLVAVDFGGARVWSHEFGETGMRLVETAKYRENPVRVDLDGDGRVEVLAFVQKGETPQENRRSMTVLCFSDTGRLRWSYTPSITYRYGGRTFDGPNRFLSWTMAPDGALWLAVNHHTWWPTEVVRVDREGRAETRYHHAGGIYAMAIWKPDHRAFLVAGGLNNEHESAVVSVLPLNAPPASSPQTVAEFQCDGCPSTPPDRMFVLPRTDINPLHNQPHNWLEDIDVTDDDLQLTVKENDIGFIVYTVSPDMQRARGVPADTFRHAHALLERAGKLDHHRDACPVPAQVASIPPLQ